MARMAEHKQPSRQVSEVVARPVRTGVQGSAAWLITELIHSFVHLDTHQYALVLSLLTLFIAFVQTAVENYAGRGFLRQPPVRQPAEVVTEARP